MAYAESVDPLLPHLALQKRGGEVTTHAGSLLIKISMYILWICHKCLIWKYPFKRSNLGKTGALCDAWLMPEGVGYDTNSERTKENYGHSLQ